MKILAKFILFTFISLLLFGCATTSIKTQAELAQGKRYFDAGYYQSAMRDLLPLAADGHAEAQYAVGYMYYYGYGVAKDSNVGYFWIKRAADHDLKSALKALQIMRKEKQPTV